MNPSLRNRPATGGVRCPSCNAMNAANRRTCDLCGKPMTPEVSSPPPRPVGQTCGNCGRPLGSDTEACPACGRMQTPPQQTSPSFPNYGSVGGDQNPLTGAVARAALAVMPSGWQVEPQPDGKIRMRRTVWARLNSHTASILGTLLFTSLLPVFLIGLSGGYTVSSGAIGFLVLGLFIAAVVCLALVREELFVSPHFLEQRFTFGSIVRSKKLTGPSTFQIKTGEHGGWTRTGPRTVRILEAHGPGPRIVLEHHTRYHHRGVFSGGELWEEPDPAGILARYLSAQTGWPMMDPHRGVYPIPDRPA